MPRPLRFCMITTFYPPYHYGGDAVFVQRLSNELAQRGHHVEVIHCVDSFRLSGAGQPRDAGEQHPDVVVHSLKSRWGVLAPLSTFATGIPLLQRKAIRRILAAGFDVIHYHNVSLVGGAGVLGYGSAIKLYTPHEYWLICPTHMLFRYKREPCGRRDCVSCSLVHRRPPQLWRYTGMLDRALKHVDAFLALTSFTEAIHRQAGLDLPFRPLSFFVPPEDGEALVDPTDETEKSASPPYFLYVGRLEKLKGVQTLIPLFRDYAKAQLWIAGTGSYEGRLRQLAQGRDNIRFLGQLPYERLGPLYRNAVAVMVPSLFPEISPLVAIEAAAHKTPVIARNLGGLREIVEQLGGGAVYDSGEEMVAAMDRLCGDPDLRAAQGRSCYAAAQRKWSMEAHVSRYLGLIAEIAERRGDCRASP
jgi:glycosyltransferase involved in cell wall biosynthesis